ncbi:MAG: WbqC family protein [Prevotellaceae bacterium]|nr:WbqC family protein [Prevotellaceae bacterium]
MEAAPVKLSTAYWAPIQYYAKLVSTPAVLLEQHEHYVKQTYRNRCRIAGANGVQQLTVPVVKRHGGKIPIREVRIDYTEGWQRQHWRAIETAYRSSPFFAYYADDIRPFYEKKETFLFDLNEKILRSACELTGITTAIGYTAQFCPPAGHPADCRYSITPKISFALDESFLPQTYYQVFARLHSFLPNLSILDLLCNEGTNSLEKLRGKGDG